MSAVIAPLHDWRRHHPRAKRIAARLIEHAGMLALPRWRVIHDVREITGCSDYMARQAVAIARKSAGIAA